MIAIRIDNCNNWKRKPNIKMESTHTPQTEYLGLFSDFPCVSPLCSPKMPITSHYCHFLLVGEALRPREKRGLPGRHVSSVCPFACPPPPCTSPPLICLFIEGEKLITCRCRQNDLSFLHVLVLGQIATNLAARSSVGQKPDTGMRRLCQRCSLG